MSKQPSLSYADSGVDIDVGNAFVRAIAPLAAKTRRKGADAALGGFGGIFDIGALGYRDPLLVAANDGVGTKLKIAIETGRHSTIGIDLVAMCVNDLIVQGAEPLFFLDYLATARLDIETGARIVEGIAEGCRQAGCALLGGETAEMPGMYSGDDYDLAGFSVGAVERDQLLPRPDIAAGDVLLALGSSGLHSNGFSLVRRIVESSSAALDAPAPFDPSTDLVDALLAPTQIYVQPLLKSQRQTGAIKAMAHITGGGLPENLPRVLPDGCRAVIDGASWTPPAVFQWLRQSGNVDPHEMARTFNCGVGMVVVTAPDAAAELISLLGGEDQAVWQIGLVEPSPSQEVVFQTAIKWNEQ